MNIQDISYRILNNVMRPDFRRKVINVALDYREKATRDERKDIENAIRNKIKNVKGFSNPCKAPVSKLIDPCIKGFEKDGSFIAIVLRLWALAKVDLLEKVESHLISEKGLIIVEESSRNNFASVWSSELMAESANEFITLFPDFNYDEVALMMCYLTGKAPIPEDQISKFIEEVSDPTDPTSVAIHIDENDGKEVPDSSLNGDEPYDDEVGVTIEKEEPASLTSIDCSNTKNEEVNRSPDPSESSSEILSPVEDMVDQIGNNNLSELLSQLNKAQDFVKEADFGALFEWLENYKTIIKLTQNELNKQAEAIRNSVSELHNSINDLNTHDREGFLEDLQYINALIQRNVLKNIPDLRDHISALREKIQDHVEKLQSAKDDLALLTVEIENLKLQARKWIDDETTLEEVLSSKTDLSNEGLGLIEVSTQVVEYQDTRRRLLDIVETGRSNYIIKQKQEISRGLALLLNAIGMHDNKEIEHELCVLLDAIDKDIPDNDLLLVPEKAKNLISRIVVKDLAEECRTSATLYSKDPTQINLENLLSSLFSASRNKEGAILLASSIHGTVWERGASLPDGELKQYFEGLLSFTSDDELVDIACSVLEDRNFSTLVNLNHYDDRLFIKILSSALFLARPHLSFSDILWGFYDSEIIPFVSWSRLIGELKLNTLPLVIRREDITIGNFETWANEIDKEFQKNGGKYLRTAGAGNKDLLNMEQKHILPDLERRWREIVAIEPSDEEWNKKCDEILAKTPEEIYANAVNLAGLNQDSNTYFRKSFEDKYGLIHDLIKKCISEKERKQENEEKSPIFIDDLQEELEGVEELIGSSLCKIIRATLEEYKRNISNQESNRISPVNIEERLAKAILEDLNLSCSLPNLSVWIADNCVANTSGWKDFIALLIKDLSTTYSIEDVFPIFLNNNLPDLALSIAEQFESESEIEQAKLKKQQLQTRFDEMISYLNDANIYQSPVDLLRWKNRRYSLVLKSLSEKVDEIDSKKRDQEKNLQDTFNQIFEKAGALEQKVYSSSEMPSATKSEVIQALSAVKEVCILAQNFRLDAAIEVLAEVTHLLEYPGAGSEIMLSAVETLRSTHEQTNNGEIERHKVFDNTNIRELLKSLEESDWTRLKLKPDVLSDNQLEERRRLLEYWLEISELPFDTANIQNSDLTKIRKFCDLFASTSQLLHGENTKRSPITNVFYSKPIPHFETSFRSPRVPALRNKVVLLFVTQATLNKRELRTIEQTINDENWLVLGYYIILVATNTDDLLTDWARRVFPKKPIVVFSESDIVNMVLSTENPTATGYLRRKLLRVSGPNRFEIFKFEEKVDEELNIFVGRTSEIRALVDSNQSHAIYGGRKIGKTSLLNAVRRELQQRGVQTVDVSVEGSEGLDVRNLEGLPIAREILQNLKINEDCNSLSDFKAILSSHLNENPDTKIVILLDEVDRYIKARDEMGQPHDLIHVFRGLYQQNNGQIRFILAGFLELWRQLHGKGKISGQETPWFNFVSYSRALEGLNSTDAQLIVKQGFQQELGIRLVKPSIPRLVVEKTTGHPAFVQKFCERLQKRVFDLGVDQISEDDVLAVFEDHSDGSYISYVNATLGQNLTPLPQLIVYLLAIEKVDLFNLVDIKNRGIKFEKGLGDIPETSWKDSLDELLVTSVIKTGPKPNYYTFSVPSYPEILRQFEVTNQEKIFDLIKEVLGVK